MLRTQQQKFEIAIINLDATRPVDLAINKSLLLKWKSAKKYLAASKNEPEKVSMNNNFKTTNTSMNDCDKIEPK